MLLASATATQAERRGEERRGEVKLYEGRRNRTGWNGKAVDTHGERVIMRGEYDVVDKEERIIYLRKRIVMAGTSSIRVYELRR